MTSGRDEFIKRLREDPRYRAALGRARNAEERKNISTVVEGFVGSFGDILGPAIEQARNDPKFATKLAKALKEREGVLSKSQQETSGSAG